MEPVEIASKGVASEVRRSFLERNGDGCASGADIDVPETFMSATKSTNKGGMRWLFGGGVVTRSLCYAGKMGIVPLPVREAYGI
jgi:hypothetical protein